MPHHVSVVAVLLCALALLCAPAAAAHPGHPVQPVPPSSTDSGGDSGVLVGVATFLGLVAVGAGAAAVKHAARRQSPER